MNAKITITIATENFNDCFCFFVEVEWAYNVSYCSIDSQILILDSTQRVWSQYLYFWQPFKESYYLGNDVSIQVYIAVFQFMYSNIFDPKRNKITRKKHRYLYKFYFFFSRSQLMVLAVTTTMLVLLFFLILTCVQSSPQTETSLSSHEMTKDVSCCGNKGRQF